MNIELASPRSVDVSVYIIILYSYKYSIILDKS